MTNEERKILLGCSILIIVLVVVVLCGQYIYNKASTFDPLGLGKPLTPEKEREHAKIRRDCEAAEKWEKETRASDQLRRYQDEAKVRRAKKNWAEDND